MKFLFRSGWGESLSLARRVEKEGNLVRFSIVEPMAQSVGLGLIERTKDLPGSISWADVVVFDSNSFDMPKEAQRAIVAGKNVVGSSEFAGHLEKDRLFAADLARGAGIEVNNFRRFEGKGAWQQARKFLVDQEGGWVWKPNGEGEICSTYVAKDVDEMFRMLNYFERLHTKEKQPPDFILTPVIEGDEVSTEAWFSGNEFFLANNTIERNRVFPGDLGEKVGCAGNVVWVAPDPTECPLFDELLSPLNLALKKARYRGPIDVNAIIESESGSPVFLEFTPRFGYDAIFALSHLVKDDLAGLLADTAMGRRWTGKVITDQFAGALGITVPPFPDEPNPDESGVPIFGFNPEEVDPRVSPLEVRLINGEPETSGPTGVPFIVSATGESPDAAMAAAEKTDIKIPLMRYRNDLPEAIQEVYEKLCETKWIKGPEKRTVFGRHSYER